MRLALPLLAVALAAGPAAAQGAFSRVATTLPQGWGYESAAPADYDGDGDLDLLVVRTALRPDSTVERVTELHRNDGAVADLFTFTRVPFPAPAAPAVAGASETVAWADPDNDGDVDALVATEAGVALYRNDAGAFAAEDTGLPPYRETWTFYFAEPRSSAWADYDNDGDLDLAVPEFVDRDYPEPDASRLVLYRNDGDALAPTTVPFPEADRDLDLTWGDVDGDGDLDLLYLSAGPHCIAPRTGECLVLYDNAGGTLAPRPLDFPGFEGGAADLGDFDLDGDLDVLLVGVIPAARNDTLTGRLLNRAIVYRNDGAAFAADTLAFPVELWNLTAGQWADYDSDGDVDVLVGGAVDDRAGPPSGYGSAAFVFANDGGAFTLTDALPASHTYGTTTWADFDGDGDLDLLTSGSRLENTVGNQWEWVYFARLFRNDAPAANAPPAAPADLAAAPTADGVTLSWTPAEDDHTAPDALTYNLRVRAATGSDIVSPMARPDGSGGRLVPAPGNVSQNLQWTLRDLAPGTYTWAVQAVDNAFNGGVFAAEGTFTVGAVAADPGATGGPLALAVAPSPAVGRAGVTVVLRDGQPATVAVYDALGRRVAVLHDGPLAAGAHAFALDASALAPGLYVVRARAGGEARARPFVVTR